MSPRKARPAKSNQDQSPSGKPQKDSADSNPVLQRINKVLAAAGLGSRRQVDELIEQGRVEINGEVITQVGVKVDLSSDSIVVDGELLKQHRPVYFALHKPEGVLCTNRDPQGRPRVIDFVPNQHRLFPVGRLDASSTGLILLTNDGELAQQLAHPKHEIPKRYAVVVVGQVELDALKRLERGIYLAEGKAQVDHAKLKKVRKSSTELEITLSEGKNREIRRVLARLGHKVVSLKRIAIGTLKLGDLPEGAYRPLSNHEVQGLYQAVDDVRRERKAARKARKKLAAANEANQTQSEEQPKTKSAKPGKPSKASGKTWEKLPSLAQNPYATEDDLAENSSAEHDDELILIRDQGPVGLADDDSDEEFFFMPRKRSGSVIGQEDDPEIESEDTEGIEFELFDSSDEDDEDFDDLPSDREEARPRRGGKRAPDQQAGRQQAGRPREGRQKPGRQKIAGRSDRGPRDGGQESGGRRNSEPRKARGMGLRQEGQARSGSAQNRDGLASRGPRKAGPKSGGMQKSATGRAGSSRGGPKKGGPARGGPKKGGPGRGGPKRGGRSGRGPKRS